MEDKVESFLNFIWPWVNSESFRYHGWNKLFEEVIKEKFSDEREITFFSCIPNCIYLFRVEAVNTKSDILNIVAVSGEDKVFFINSQYPKLTTMTPYTLNYFISTFKIGSVMSSNVTVGNYPIKSLWCKTCPFYRDLTLPDFKEVVDKMREEKISNYYNQLLDMKVKK